MSPTVAARWKSLLPVDGTRWMAEGFDDPDIAKRWSDSGFSPKGARLSDTESYVTPRHAVEDWLSYSFDRSHLSGWGEVSGSPREAQQYRDAGFLLEESRQAAAWHDEGVAVEVATVWHAKGLTPRDYEAWTKAGVADPAVAWDWEHELEGEAVEPATVYAEWEPAGFTFTLAGYWIGRGVYSPTDVPPDEGDDDHMVNV